MTIDTVKYLEHQKKKLTAIFTFVVFWIILLIEVFFLVFKYFDIRNQEFDRLNGQIEMMSREITKNSFMRWFLFWDQPPRINNLLPKFWGKERRIRDLNFLIYNSSTNDVLFSPIDEKDFLKNILSKSIASVNTIYLDSQEYYFVNKNIDNNISILVFSESHFSKVDVFRDFFQYFVFILILSVLFYYLWYKFVSYNLSPVAENIKDMEQFIYNAWHELKTPLSVVKSSLQLSKAKNNFSEIDDTIKELDNMNNLINSLISLSNIKSEVDNVKIDVSEKLQDIIKEYDIKLKAKNIKLNFVQLHNQELLANPEYFKILFSNILSNAIKYNKEWWEINISVDKWSVSINDTWVWINKENLSRVFERFFQDTDARNQDWFGIWLSLVRKIADIYGWKIDIDSIKDVGTTIKVIF